MAQDVTPDQEVAVVVGNTEVSSTAPFPVTVVGASGGTPTEQPISAADGKLATLGTTTDAAKTTDVAGTVVGFLRGLVKIFADVWDSTNHGFGIKSVAPAATPTHTADATVDGTAGGTTISGANPARKAAIIQVVSGGNARVSIGGTPTASNGLQVGVGGAPLIVEGNSQYGCPTGAIKAIREGSVSAVIAVVEFA